MKFTKEIKIEGMHCSGCSARVERALNALDGVKATVDLKAGTAKIVSSAEVPDAVLKETVESLGFVYIG